jgi:hypothetical protein
MGWVSQLLSIIAALMFSTLVSYVLTIVLIKINRKLLFLLPILFGILAAILWTLGLLSEDWGAFGYLLYGSFAIIAAVGSLISSIIIFKASKKSLRN